MKTIILIISFVAIAITSIKGQDTIVKDPLLQFKNFYEFSISVNGTRVNTNHIYFNTNNETYNFDKGNYIPTLDGLINYGWIFKDNKDGIMTLKTGINLTSRGGNVVNRIGEEMKYQEGFIQIPVIFGIRMAKNFNTVKNNLFRATEYNFGLYTSLPYYEKLDYKNNLDSDGTLSFGNYLRFGGTAEIVFSALNNKGHGHKFGIRASIDFNTIIKFKNTKYELYPYYNTIGLFYNILNIHK
ncbi:MAG: hypothetical protein PHW92_14355 [Lutibacter sp.]|jgi:hypothetical protein|nr:hypothetical protein [Lutibacter sp.]